MKKTEQFALINRKKLKGLLAENNLTYSDVSKDLGISRQAFYNKMVGIRLFNEHEIYILKMSFGNDIFLD